MAGQGFNLNPDGYRARLIRARLAYIAAHGARFLFSNQPPPAPGWPKPHYAPEDN